MIHTTDSDLAAELHQVDVDGSTTMTKSDRPRAASSDSNPTVVGLWMFSPQTSQTRSLFGSSNIRMNVFLGSLKKTPRLDTNSSRGCCYGNLSSGNHDRVDYVDHSVGGHDIDLHHPSVVHHDFAVLGADMRIVRPLTVGAERRFTTSLAVTLPGTTW